MNQDTARRNRRIIEMHDKGLTYAEIARATGITRQRAHQIVKSAIHTPVQNA